MTVWSPPLAPPHARGRALSLEEWLALDGEDAGEVVDGFWEEDEVPDAIHELAVTWLAALLRAWLGATGSSSSAPRYASRFDRAPAARETSRCTFPGGRLLRGAVRSGGLRT